MSSCSTESVRAESLRTAPRGTPRPLYSAVKFRLVAREIRRHARREGLASPRVLDVGCADQEALRCFAEEGLGVAYCGVDPDEGVSPHLVGDARALERLREALPWTPDVILLLDVLERLGGDEDDVRRALRACAEVLAPGGLVLVAVPQMDRLARLALPHLPPDGPRVRLSLDGWRRLLSEEFRIESTQGIGYLSVVPSLPMLSRAYREENVLGRSSRLLGGRLLAWKPIADADAWLSDTVGRVDGLTAWANDVLLVCRVR